MSEFLQYEQAVRELTQQLVDDPEVPVEGSKLYTGRFSGHEHQIDLSYQFEKGGTAHLVIVECKCYAKPVGIDDMLVLVGRAEDIGAHKAVCVTTRGFQRGALNYARAKRVGLIRASLADALLDHEVILRFTAQSERLEVVSSEETDRAMRMFQSEYRSSRFPPYWPKSSGGEDGPDLRMLRCAASRIKSAVLKEKQARGPVE